MAHFELHHVLLLRYTPAQLQLSNRQVLSRFVQLHPDEQTEVDDGAYLDGCVEVEGGAGPETGAPEGALPVPGQYEHFQGVQPPATWNKGVTVVTMVTMMTMVSTNKVVF